jgi:DNA-binding LacI/PurR family transcriptional regulator
MTTIITNNKRFFPKLEIDKTSPLPLHVQLADVLKRSLIKHRVMPGTALPSERKISDLLEINRNTVHRAYEQLVSEGLAEEIEGRRGLFVADSAKNKYRPSFPAIGIVMPISFSQFISMSSQNGLNYLSGIIDRATELNHSTMIINLPDYDEHPDKIKIWIDSFISKLCGIINLGDRYNDHDKPFEALMTCRHIPHIFISGYSEQSNISSVSGDVASGGMAAAELLRDNGHRNVGLLTLEFPHLSNRMFKNFAKKRLDVLKACFKKCDLTVKPEWISHSCDKEENINQEIIRIFSQKNPPTALWCQNDEIALSAIKALNDFGLDVPNDVSVIGFDDIREGWDSKPALTTIKQPCYSVGRQAVELAVDLFKNGSPGEAKTIKIPTSLIVRESVGKAKNGITQL